MVQAHRNPLKLISFKHLLAVSVTATCKSLSQNKSVFAMCQFVWSHNACIPFLMLVFALLVQGSQLWRWGKCSYRPFLEWRSLFKLSHIKFIAFSVTLVKTKQNKKKYLTPTYLSLFWSLVKIFGNIWIPLKFASTNWWEGKENSTLSEASWCYWGAFFLELWPLEGYSSLKQ